ncbi:MAG: hypothetical protein IKM61_00665 [Eubacteriaceae bacterium]|nr:hypothetical protein [Eubacteriaceae bacterium]
MMPLKIDFNYPITAKENMQMVFDKKKPLWVPNMTFDKGVIFNTADNDRPFFGKTDYDWFGVHWTDVPTVGGQMVTPGTFILDDPAEWVEKLVFPNLDDYDFTEVGKKAAENADPTKFNFYLMQNGLFERWLSLVDPADGLAYLYEEKETAKEYFKKMADYKIAMMEKVIREFAPIDGFINSDDWGTQQSMFISPDMWRYLVHDEMKRITDYAHSQGKYVDYHSCGKCGDLAPQMIECGADMWEAQGMNDLVAIRNRYGSALPIQIGMDAAYLNDLERTDEELIQYVHNFVDTYALDGGLLTSTFHKDPRIAELLARELYEYSTWYYKNR